MDCAAHLSLDLVGERAGRSYVGSGVTECAARDWSPRMDRLESTCLAKSTVVRGFVISRRLQIYTELCV